MNNKEKPSVEFTIQEEELQELIKKRDELLVKRGAHERPKRKAGRKYIRDKSIP